MTTNRRRRGRLAVQSLRLAALLLPVFALMWIGGGARIAHGYTFLIETYASLFRHDLDGPHHSVLPVEPWSERVWPPGETLSFVLVDSPLWYPWFSDIHEVERFFEEAMDVWENVPAADIRWEVGRIDASETASEPASLRTSTIVPVDEGPSRADILYSGDALDACVLSYRVPQGARILTGAPLLVGGDARTRTLPRAGPHGAVSVPGIHLSRVRGALRASRVLAPPAGDGRAGRILRSAHRRRPDRGVAGASPGRLDREHRGHLGKCADGGAGSPRSGST